MTQDEHDDERLAAWLDSALPSYEMAEFAARIDADPALAAKAAQWRANDRFISGALAPILDMPTDHDLLERLGLGSTPLPVAANDNRPWWRRHALPLGGALAACLALVTLVSPNFTAPAKDTLSLALESTPAGSQARLADGSVIEPVLTVRAADGRWCREFRAAGSIALACRGTAGWKVEGKAQGNGPGSADTIGLASGESGKGLDATCARLGASDPVAPSAEAALIRKGWGDR